MMAPIPCLAGPLFLANVKMQTMADACVIPVGHAAAAAPQCRFILFVDTFTSVDALRQCASPATTDELVVIVLGSDPDVASNLVRAAIRWYARPRRKGRPRRLCVDTAAGVHVITRAPEDVGAQQGWWPRAHAAHVIHHRLAPWVMCGATRPPSDAAGRVIIDMRQLSASSDDDGAAADSLIAWIVCQVERHRSVTVDVLLVCGDSRVFRAARVHTHWVRERELAVDHAPVCAEYVLFALIEARLPCVARNALLAMKKTKFLSFHDTPWCNTSRGGGGEEGGEDNLPEAAEDVAAATTTTTTFVPVRTYVLRDQRLVAACASVLLAGVAATPIHCALDYALNVGAMQPTLRVEWHTIQQAVGDALDALNEFLVSMPAV